MTLWVILVKAPVCRGAGSREQGAESREKLRIKNLTFRQRSDRLANGAIRRWADKASDLQTKSDRSWEK